MSGQNASLGSVFGLFSEFERGAGLFSREVCGVRYWHYVRFGIYSALVLPQFVPMDAAHPDMHIRPARSGGIVRRIASRCRRAWQLLRMLVWQNPSFSVRRSDVLFSVAPRTALLPDGRRVRLAIDFFVDRLKSSWSVLELPVGTSGYQVHDGRGRAFRWEAAKRAIDRYRKSAAFRSARPEIAAAARDLTAEMAARLGVSVDEATVRRRMESAVVLERSAVPLLRRWLRRLRVKCVVEVVHYGSANMALTRAAHAERIPVVELQHGTVVSSHAAYNLPVRDSPNTPDTLLAWGEFWIAQTRNFPTGDAVPVGYPYLESFLPDEDAAGGRRAGSRCTVVYVSQGTVGRAMAESAVQLRRLLPEGDFAVLYKLHPNEMKTWRSIYPGLVGSGVEVLDDPQCPIYSIYSQADVTVGSYSTALVEGFMWGLPAYVLRNLSGSDLMEPFSATGMVMYVDGTDDLAARLRGGEWRSMRFGGAQSSLWRRGAAEAIARYIDGVVAGGARQ